MVQRPHRVRRVPERQRTVAPEKCPSPGQQSRWSCNNSPTAEKRWPNGPNMSKHYSTNFNYNDYIMTTSWLHPTLHWERRWPNRAVHEVKRTASVVPRSSSEMVWKLLTRQAPSFFCHFEIGKSVINQWKGAWRRYRNGIGIYPILRQTHRKKGSANGTRYCGPWSSGSYLPAVLKILLRSHCGSVHLQQRSSP